MGRSKDVTYEQKQMINYLHERRFSGAFIGRQLNLSKQVISKIITAWRRGEIFKVDNRKMRRRAKLTAQQCYKILKYFLDHPFHTYNQCIVRLNLCVSENTVRNVLKEDGVRNCVACEKPFLTLLNQLKRLRFALKYRYWTANDWKNVSFLDEKTIQTYRNGRLMVKRRVNERFHPDKIGEKEKQNSKNKVNLVGFVCHHGPNKIYSVSTKLTGKEFNQLIQMKIKHEVKGTVLMDNAPIHNEGIKNLMESGVRVVDFPPKSPDMNIIENVWSLLQRIMNFKLRTVIVSTKEELLKIIEESWKEVDIKFIDNCIDSMPNRLREVIKMKGRATRY